MRSAILFGAVIAAAITGCSTGSGIQVRTAVEPDANLSGLHTFYVLTAPSRSTSATPLPATDPMLDNSITNRALRGDLTTALESRGYAPTSRQGADFLVAYYAGTKQKLDTTYWGPTFDPGWRYQYRGRRGWAWPYYGASYYGMMNPWGAQQASVTSSTQGQVIVDITDPKTNELIWRGQGVEPVSGDPAQYASDLQGVVNAIVARFPQASAQPVATSNP